MRGRVALRVVAAVASVAVVGAAALVGRSMAPLPGPSSELADVVSPIGGPQDPPVKGQRLGSGELLGTEVVTLPDEDQDTPAGEDGDPALRQVADQSLPPGTPDDVALAVALAGATPSGRSSGATTTTTAAADPPPSSGDAPSGGAPGLAVVDPCAVAGEAPPSGSGCPEGVRSVVLATFSPEPLEPLASAEPLTREEWPAGVTPFLFCPRATLAAGEVRFGVSASTPGTATITVEPADDAGVAPPGSERTFTVATTPEQLAAWQTDFEPDGHVALDARPQLCTTLTGLGGFTQWRYRVSYEDIFGRTASASGGYLRVPSRSTVPQPTVLPLGTGQFFVSAPHKGADFVRIGAEVTDSTEPCPLRRSTGRYVPPGSLPAVSSATLPVSPGYLAARGYDSSYTEVSTARFVAPPGREVLVCLLTFADGSTQTLAPSSVTTIRLRTPGAALASATLDSVHLAARTGSNSLKIVAFRSTGPTSARCGGWTGPRDEDLTNLDYRLCSAPSDREVDEWRVIGPLLDQPFVIRTTVTRDGRTFSKSTVLANSKAARCRSLGCPTPPPAVFEVPLPTAPVPSGLCGSSFGPCDPPTSERSLGVARVRVDWTAPAPGSASRWEVGAPSSARPAPSPAPMFDWMVTPTIERAGTANPGLRASLKADRLVTWSVTLSGCDRPGATRTLTGPASPTFRIAFDDLCPGADHFLDATITDPRTGASSTWNATSVAAFTPGWWPGANIRIPGERVPVAVYLVAERPPAARPISLLAADQGEVRLGNLFDPARPDVITGEEWAQHPERRAYEPTQTCNMQGLDPRNGLRGHQWNLFRTLDLGTGPLPVSASAQLFGANGTSARCTVNYSVFNMFESSVSGTVSSAQLRNVGDEVRITSAADAEFPLTLIIKRTR